MPSIISQIRKELKQNADKKLKKSGERFFKEPVKMYGMKTALGLQIGKKNWPEIQDKDKQEIFALCEELWQSGYMEESFIACNWSYYLNKQYEQKDWAVFEKWVKNYVSNWASCDTLCNHTIGSFVTMYPEFIKNLKQWAKSKNRWVKRASAVTLIIPARHGKFLKDIFEIADMLLLDNDDLVQKGYGWMLKAASESHQKEVFDYVMKNKTRMPRTALRYSIEKMPKALKVKAMAK
ncbi:MAG TPA: DNA alkylation repair protein [Candidatus Magasanikbacteria bacterium]|nr:DNA alkylation repair protein [Candidatus Magasanikbacteria bacterium]